MARCRLSLLVALLLLAACGQATPAPTATAPPATTAPTVAAPTVAPTTPPTVAPTATQRPRPTPAPTASPTTAPSPTPVLQARLERLTLAKGVKDFEPVDPAASFKLGTKKIYLTGRVVGAPRGTKLKVAWKVVNMPGQAGTDEVLERELAAEGTRPFAFSLEVPQPLPAGQYAAELSLNGKLVERLPFSVLAPAVPVLARPENELPSAPGSSAAAPESKPTNLQFIIDVSGSMADPLGGVPKMETAREALHALVSALPSKPERLNVGLRAYAHRYPVSDKAKSCEDTELLVPMQGVDKAKLRQQIDGLKATGWTPMAFAVQQAAKDFTAGEAQNVAVLISDGEETCVQDPVAVIKEAAAPVKLTVHVVGFDIGEEKARKQLQAIAQATGGIYVDARGAADLAAALRKIAAEEVKVIRLRAGTGQLTVESPPGATFYNWKIIDRDGKEAVSENGEDLQRTYQLPAGLYTVRFKPDIRGEGALFRIEIATGQESVLRLGALKLITRTKPYLWVLVDKESEQRVSDPHGTPDGPLVVPPGRYIVLTKVTISAEEVVVTRDLEIKPNTVVEVEL